MGITQVFDEFYEPNTNSLPQFGSVYWVPTPEVPEVHRILEVRRASPEEHEITDFEFVEIADRHFKPNSRLPIKRLNLGDTQELLITKAKKRPCVVLGMGFISSDKIDSIADGEQRRLAKHLHKPIHLVAPMYGCATYTDRTAFGPVLTARVKALWYPHLCYMPPLNPKDKASNPGSILRLDHVFPSHLGRGSESAGIKLKDEVLEIVVDQLKVVFDQPESENLTMIRELVKDCLPEELK